MERLILFAEILDIKNCRNSEADFYGILGVYLLEKALMNSIHVGQEGAVVHTMKFHGPVLSMWFNDYISLDMHKYWYYTKHYSQRRA